MTAIPSIVKLQFSDGRPDVIGIESANAVLRGVGVRVSTVPIPEAAKPILKASQLRVTTEEEQRQLISIFSLTRADLLEQISLAGRVPGVHRGGYLSISEVDVPPYPKVYDLKAMTPEWQTAALVKFGRLHVNTADDGAGIDEVMTVVSGGPMTWFFVLLDGVVVRLTVDRVGLDDRAVRLSYPGIGIHGGFLDAKQGLIVAYAHGPKEFVMRYEEPAVLRKELLGTNPWINFSESTPTLFDKVAN